MGLLLQVGAQASVGLPNGSWALLGTVRGPASLEGHSPGWPHIFLMRILSPSRKHPVSQGFSGQSNPRETLIYETRSKVKVLIRWC